MSQASAGASEKPGKGAAAKPARPLVQPLSPHLQVWRWHVTMLGSILHRVTGVGLYGGAILTVVWLGFLGAGRDAYTQFLTYAAHPLALIVWVGLTLCAFYHLLSGIRHLIWDTGAGLKPKSADALVNLSLWLTVLLTVAFWAWLFVDGRIAL
jgi:succinate dehydrogenase / fumarate reductase cytochrome b subunit